MKLYSDERPHSVVGPSSFDRAEICPASVINDGQVRTESSFAAEGTAAHSVFEAALRSGEEVFFYEGTQVCNSKGDVTLTVDMAMIEALDPMVESVRDTFDPDFELEPRLDMPGSQMYGYADVIGYHNDDGILTVGDLKYGSQFVAANALQLGLYGLMALFARGTDLSEVGYNDKDAAVRTIIYQPRCPGSEPIREHIWTVGDLKDLMMRVRTFDKLVATGGNTLPYKAGKHCRWCPRTAMCPMLKSMVKDAAATQMLGAPVEDFDLEALEDSANILPAIKQWVKATEETIGSYLRAGGKMQNMKLIKGRGSRAWSDFDKAAKLMGKHGVDPYAEPKPLSPPQAEKLLPKLLRGELKQFVETTEGKAQMVPGDDGREAITVVKALENANLAMMAGKLLDRST